MLWIPSSDGSDKSRIEWKFLVHSLQLRMVSMSISNKNHDVFSRFRNEGTYRSSSKSSWIMFFWGVEMVETEGCREQRRTRLASITQTTNSLAVLGCWIAGDHPCDIFFWGGGAIIFSARGWFDDVFFSYKKCWRANSFFFQNPPEILKITTVPVVSYF